MDLNMPRDKETGKTKGFGFLMYEDQRSTVLAVDNLNGAKVLEKTLRVDHVKNYKQPKVKGDDGEWAEPEEQSLNAKPQIIDGMSTRSSIFQYNTDTSWKYLDMGADSDSSASSAASIDPEDPMRDYLIAKRTEEKALKKSKKSKSKGKHKDETPEERRARKARKKEKKAKKTKSAGVKGVESLLSTLVRDFDRPSSGSPVEHSGRDRSPVGSSKHRPRSLSRQGPPPDDYDQGERKRPRRYSRERYDSTHDRDRESRSRRNYD